MLCRQKQIFFFKNRKYQLAYEKYQEAYGIAKFDTNNAVQQEYLKGKIDTMKNIKLKLKIRTNGDTLFSNKNIKKLEKYIRKLQKI